MSREKSVWFAEEILLDAKLINFQLETGEWNAVEEMLRAESQLSRDTETGRLRPKKASEYTLRLIAEVLHIMKLDIEQGSYNISTLAVAEQCLRLIRSCAASGMKIQTYISKDLSILDDMLTIFTEYQHPSDDLVNEELAKKFESCMVALTQTLGNLVVNNPFNQTIIWEKFGSNIMNALLGHNEKIASCAAMIVYNILLGQPNVLPDDVLLLNALAYMYAEGNSEFPHLIIEYLIGVENSYIEKLYNRLEPDTRLLILNLAYNILMSIETQDINVSVNFIKFIAHEFKTKSDCILKTVDKYVNSIEPQEVVFLLDIIATASSMEAYLDCLQSDVSLFINCAFLLRSIHDLGKYEDNFFTSIKKLYQTAGKPMPDNADEKAKIVEVADTPETNQSIEEAVSVKKCDSTDNMLQGTETVSECTESECSEQYYECTDQPPFIEPLNLPENLQTQITLIDNNKPMDSQALVSPGILPEAVAGLNFGRQGSMDRKISDANKLDENLIKVAFSKYIKPDISQSIPSGEILEGGNITPLSGTSIAQSMAQSDLNLNRKISLDHKIDILDEMEPPLITDSPEETQSAALQTSTPNLSRESSLDTSRMERKDSIAVPNLQSNNPTPFNMSRQQSVEPGIEASETVIREMTIELNSAEQTSEANQNVASNVPQAEGNQNLSEAQTFNPNNIEIEAPANIVTHPKASEPIPVKKSQNLSTEFDLSEQLQKILGISTDKANLRSDSLDIVKDTHSVQITHAKVEPPQPLSQSVNLPPTPVLSAEHLAQKPKPHIRVPNVKIDSPENNMKSKLGNFDNAGPKKLATVTESVEQHVAFGFKGTVIRTLGNLCWKNQINKRQIRELDIIPILLDCCNIDARNPLIMQWVIFAVRNLCENCPENQAVIASLTLQEPVDNEVLTEMGLTMHTNLDNNSIKIVPLLKK